MSGGGEHFDRLKDMFYLEGDFSDRCIHDRQSQHVLGGQLTLELIEVLEQHGELRQRRSGFVRTAKKGPKQAV